VKDLFEPKTFFERIRPGLLMLRSTVPLRAIFKEWPRHLPILFREFYYLGVRAKGIRWYFWKTFFQVLWKNPAALEAFGWDCYHYDYLKQHAEYVHRELSEYLFSPSPGDVLDEVIPAFESPAAAASA
jgi:hypothetical protein